MTIIHEKQETSKKASFKYQYHLSITNIEGIMKSKNISTFRFQSVSIDKVNWTEIYL